MTSIAPQPAPVTIWAMEQAIHDLGIVYRRPTDAEVNDAILIARKTYAMGLRVPRSIIRTVCREMDWRWGT